MARESRETGRGEVVRVTLVSHLALPRGNVVVARPFRRWRGSLDERGATTSEPLTQGSRAGGELAVGSAQLIPAARCSCIWLSSL